MIRIRPTPAPFRLAVPVLVLAAALAAGRAGAKPAGPAAEETPAMTHADSLRCPRCADSLGVSAGGPTLGITGLLSRVDGRLVIDGCGGRTVLESITVDSLAELVGRRVWANVLCTGPGRAAALGGHALGDSIVDLWVMGLCPYARALEAKIDSVLVLPDSATHPPLRLHWIFYATDSLDVPTFHSLHGPQEMVEDIVQQGVQELAPDRLWPYLALRSHSDEPWATLAGRAGIPWNVAGEIQHRVDHELVVRAREAYEDMKLNWPHVDGSPTVYWLGHEVRSINDVPGFRVTRPPAEHCGS